MQEIADAQGAYVVRVLGCGICGTDLKTFTVAITFSNLPRFLVMSLLADWSVYPKTLLYDWRYRGSSSYYECGTCNNCTTNLKQMCTDKHLCHLGSFL
jgi:threonine dehydrogenase-like Zn-dependent dehydrogenase